MNAALGQIVNSSFLLQDVGVLNFDKNFLNSVIFTWVNVGIVAFVLYILLYKPIGGMLTARAQRVAGQIDEADKAQKDAKALKEEYELKLRDIEKERAEILDDARKRGKAKEEEIIKAAKLEAEALKDRAALDIKREQRQAEDEMKRTIIEISSLMATRFVKDSMDKKTKAKLLDESIKELGDVKWPS